MIYYASAFWELPFEEYTSEGTCAWATGVYRELPGYLGRRFWRSYGEELIDREYMSGSVPDYTRNLDY